jgi:3,4-dihydroxy 2-butanone 4-phosphate synthase/GTP cyclohydrolase II
VSAAIETVGLANALRALANGHVVVMYDERHDRADLVAAAELTTSDVVNLMAREGRGFVAVALTRERVAALGIATMRVDGRRQAGPRDRSLPLVPIEARSGVTTGISAADRAQTIRMAASGARSPADLVTPGHVFPLEAAAGGLLERHGRVEAAVDAVRLGGYTPAATLCDLLTGDGELGTLDDAVELSERVGLPRFSIGTLADARLDDVWAEA